jgi:hypothetical protein
MIQYKKLQFYADKKNAYQNRLFTFKVNNPDDAFRVMYKFAINGNTFRFASINTHFEFTPIEGEKKGTNIKNMPDYNLKMFCDYFNKCTFEEIPTLRECMNDFLMENEK